MSAHNVIQSDNLSKYNHSFFAHIFYIYPLSIFTDFSSCCSTHSLCRYFRGHPVSSCIGPNIDHITHYPYSFLTLAVVLHFIRIYSGHLIFLAVVNTVLIIIIKHTSYLSYYFFHLFYNSYSTFHTTITLHYNSLSTWSYQDTIDPTQQLVSPIWCKSTFWYPTRLACVNYYFFSPACSCTLTIVYVCVMDPTIAQCQSNLLSWNTIFLNDNSSISYLAYLHSSLPSSGHPSSYLLCMTCVLGRFCHHYLNSSRPSYKQCNLWYFF